jgi:hypothetical protein
MAGVNDWIQEMSTRNLIYGGANADIWAMIPFTILVIILYLTGREILMAPKRTDI